MDFLDGNRSLCLNMITTIGSREKNMFRDFIISHDLYLKFITYLTCPLYLLPDCHKLCGKVEINIFLNIQNYSFITLLFDG